MIFVLYLAVAAIVVLFSIKCADYVDMLDKKTNISGAFIGGVILAAVTSLPELVTSISSIAINSEGLIIGNVLGSDIFNLCIFGALTLTAVKGYRKAKMGISHMITVLCTIAAYFVTGAVLFAGWGYLPNISINIASFAIVVLYAISCRFMASDDAESEGEDENALTLRQVVTRFIICAMGLVISSVAITLITDRISEDYNLGASLAGAVFLGVATSIPELTSSITLVKKGNFNAMAGNVLGSNMFNYIIFSLADIIAFKRNVYQNSADSRLLIIFGLVSTFAALGSLLAKRVAKRKEAAFWNVVLALFGAVIILSYAAFLLCSMANGG